MSLAANFLEHILSFVGISRHKGIESIDENQFTTLSFLAVQVIFIYVYITNYLHFSTVFLTP